MARTRTVLKKAKPIVTSLSFWESPREC